MKSIALQFTSLCNLNCKMCVWKKEMTHHKMPYEQITEIINDIKRLNETKGIKPYGLIRLDGNTEPLVDKKRLIFAINEITRLLPFVKTQIVTNGVLLDDNIAKFILENGIDFLDVSITGVIPEVYRDFQGANLPEDVMLSNLDSVLTNITEFIRLKKAIGGKTKVTARYILSQENSYHLPTYYRKMHELGVGNIVQGGLLEDTWQDIPQTDNYSNNNSYIMKKKCGGFQQMVYANGEVYPYCCQWWHKPIGNIKQNSLYDILTSDKFLRNEEGHATCNPDKLSNECRCCPQLWQRVSFDNDISTIKKIPKLASVDNSGFKNNYKKVFEQMLVGRKLICWGCGEEFRNNVEPYYMNDIAYFVDTDKNKWGVKIKGIEIRPFDMLKNENPDDIVVLIAHGYFAEIEDDLIRLGIKNYFASICFYDMFCI